MIVADSLAPVARKPVFISPTPFDENRVRAAAVYCSDGRFGEQMDEFLHAGLSLPRYDRVAVPGGAALTGESIPAAPATCSGSLCHRLASREALEHAIVEVDRRRTSMTEPTKVEPIRFEDGGELHIAGLTQHYDMKDVGQIPAQWERFRPHIGHVPGQVGSTTYGVNLRLSERVEDGFDYVTGVEVRGSEAYPAGWARLPAARTFVPAPALPRGGTGQEARGVKSA